MLLAKKDSIIPNIFKCFILCLLIIIGVSRQYVSIICVILGCYYIFKINSSDFLGILFFVLPFASIFKLGNSDHTLFNIFIFVAVLRLIISDKKYNIKEILMILAFFVYAFVFVYPTSFLTLLNLMLSFILVFLVFKTYEDINLRRILIFYALGIIMSSIFGIFKDFIPGLSTYLRQVRLKNENIEILRFCGLYNNPNFYTMDISVVLASITGLAACKKAKLFDFLLIIALSVFGIMSVSKSFLLILIILIFISLLYLAKKSFLGIARGIFLICIIFVVILTFVNQEYILAYFSRLQADSQQNASLSTITTGRYDIWKMYLDYMFSDVSIMLFGKGFGAPNISGEFSHSHYIEIIYYFGIIGSALYINCIFNMLPTFNKMKRRNLMNFLPLIILIIRGLAINLILSENFVFYLIICILMLNYNLKDDFLLPMRTDRSGT